MKLLRNKKGSIFIGMLLVISVIIPFFIFTYESAILYSTKNRLDSISKNITSSAILMLDEEKTINFGMLSIDNEGAKYVANKIFDESLSSIKSNSHYFNNPTINFTAENGNDESVNAEVELVIKLKRDFVFFKDISIVSKSYSRAYSIEDLGFLRELDEDESDLISWTDILKMIRFETR